MLTNKTRVRDGRGRPLKNTTKARKVPGQARSQETVNVILEAGARILESDGLQGFNTNAVAAKASVSIGSLYQYFPNKDAILLALIGSFERVPVIMITDKTITARSDFKIEASLTLQLSRYRQPWNLRVNTVGRIKMSVKYYHGY